MGGGGRREERRYKESEVARWKIKDEERKEGGKGEEERGNMSLRGNYVAKVIQSRTAGAMMKNRPATSCALSPVRKGGAKGRSGELGRRLSACANAQIGQITMKRAGKDTILGLGGKSPTTRVPPIKLWLDFNQVFFSLV